MSEDWRFAAAARRAARLAAAELCWRPAEFWQATPAELLTALGLDQPGEAEPLGGELLARLMEAWPDGHADR